MENNELLDLWKGVGINLPQKSKKELQLLLTSKAKSVLNRFVVLAVTSCFTGCGVIIYLIIVSLGRKTDTLFIVNNLILGILILWTIIYNLFVFRFLKKDPARQSLKEWLIQKIETLNKLLNPKKKILSYVFTSMILIMIYIAIEIPLTGKTFIVFFTSKETLIATLVGLSISFLVSYFVGNRLRKYQLKNLNFLNVMYRRLEKVEE